MGLYGALVVRPAGHAGQVNDRADSAFNPAHEYVFLLSEVDPDLHLAVERAEPIDWKAFQPRYYMINGRSMPDTLAPNNASWLPNQPYGALVHIQPLRRGHQPAAGRDPLPQRRDGQLPVPPARQRRARGEPGRPCRCRARPVRTWRTSSTTWTCSPGRPWTP